MVYIYIYNSVDVVQTGAQAFVGEAVDVLFAGGVPLPATNMGTFPVLMDLTCARRNTGGLPQQHQIKPNLLHTYCMVLTT